MNDLRPLAARNAYRALFIAFAWLAATAWMRPLALPDEGRYVGVAWEMMVSGDWLTPTLDGLPYFHKPPLFYWITAGSMSVFGLNEMAARAAPLLGASIGAFAIYLFTSRWSGPRAARLTLLALLTQPLFYIGAQFANLDMLVAGLITATILALADAALCFEHGQLGRRTLVCAYALAGLGVLAKGLIGAVIPLLVIFAWLALRQRWRVMQSLVSLPGTAVFVLVATPWFVAMQCRYPDFLNYFFVVQHFKRFTVGGFNNVEPFWFYPALLLAFNLPWLTWLHHSFSRDKWLVEERGATRLLMWLWVAVVVVFFSMPQSKLVGYIIPATAPLAFLVADGFMAGSPSPRGRRMWKVGIGLGTILSLGAVLAFSVHPVHSSRGLAVALLAQRGEKEPVFMLKHYYFDLPVTAHLREPVQVVEEWADSELLQRDSWRKELADAGQFAPARASSTLITPASLMASVCRSRVSWIIGLPKDGAEFPLLSLARAIATGSEGSVWRVESAQPGIARLCAALPPAQGVLAPTKN